MVVFAVMSIVIVGFLALVVDAGMAFAQRRLLQNTADLIARAGAVVKNSTGTDASVLTAVNGVIAANGLTTVDVNVHYVDTSGNPCSTTTCGSGVTPCAVGSCSPTPSTAIGVRATPTKSFSTYFANILSQADLTASATAAVAVGGLAGFTGGAPIIACTNPYKTSGTPTGPTNIMLGSGTSADPYRVNPIYDGETVEIWSNLANDGANCDAHPGSEGFKGLTAGSFPGCSSQPCTVPTQTGNSTGPSRTRLAGATGCDVSQITTTTSGCIIVAQIGTTSSTVGCGTMITDQMCAIGWTAFELTNSGCSGNCKIRGILRLNVVVLNGTTGSSAPASTYPGPKVITTIE